MPKFTFISEDLDLNGYKTGSRLTKEFSCETLDDVIKEFDMFIRGTGYTFTGEISIVNENNITLEGTGDSFTLDDTLHEYEYDPSFESIK